ncbi:hypothetical protein [Hymenobacter jejuensis]|uniref:BREX-1 system phosphatase PglZ type B n=1 Tax=Hymenobacter jejuensis TaxID=2502781 RepID=A0A5B7ZZP0_9BACT|nr:hypothetical protein [Hymenobacter jejuensis]QDA59996.1 hypothetical protein FHG12_07670 [Hymenobacter jejuensis]
MHSVNSLLLDPHGDAPVPASCQLVDNELDWLRETANVGASVPQVVVRGQALTQWARTWWEIQGGRCTELVSPGYTLQRLVPALPMAEAQGVARELHALWGEDHWPVGLSVPTVLNALYPAAQAVWELAPSAEPEDVARAAGQWLTWLHKTDRYDWSTAHQPIVAAWLASWQQQEPQAEILMPLDPAAALVVHRAWVGLPGAPITRPIRQALTWAGPCPAPVPAEWLTAARQQWEADLPRFVVNRPADTDVGTAIAAWWTQVHSQGLHPDLLPISLSVALHYVHQNSAALTVGLLRVLRSSMPPDEYAELASRLPPPEPGPLPQEPEAVLRWTTEEYLPYRTWQAKQEKPDAAITATVRRHALAFGEWLLATYPSRLSGATHPYQHLYWTQHSRVHPQNASEVILWIIADGLGWADALHLAQQVRERSLGRIVTTEAAPCFGLLPTITHFTKVPVRTGIPFLRTLSRLPDLTAEMAADVRDHQDPVPRVRQLTGGQSLVWKPLQPDSAYHEKAEASTVRRNALGALDIMAQTIVAAAKEVPHAFGLRILITTDHGRMLGPGTRAVAVPDGFEAHGRVAYQEVPGSRPPESPDIEWLDPEYFNLPGWVGVVRDERSFLICRNDGSQVGGPDNFSHGGIWPEEVVVPWLMLQRDAVPVQVLGSATGRARIGLSGTAMLQLFNQADRPVRLRSLTLSWPTEAPLEIEINTALPGLQNTSVAVLLANWPNGLRITAAQLSITVELPDGSEQQFGLTNELSTDEFQTRQADLLGDL